MTVTPPTACRWCGFDQREHAERWHRSAGWHKHEPPTQQQIKERMLARRAERRAS